MYPFFRAEESEEEYLKELHYVREEREYWEYYTRQFSVYTSVEEWIFDGHVFPTEKSDIIYGTDQEDRVSEKTGLAKRADNVRRSS